jgi:acyl carrier protein
MLMQESYNMQPVELEVANLIIESLNLEDINADDIDPEAPLFNEGLGLDSIDALEISLVISKRYGFQIKSDDTNNAQVFASLSALSKHIEANRKN